MREFKDVNRDVIRRAAKAAGVVNVSYKSRAENVAALLIQGYVGIEDHADVGYTRPDVSAVEALNEKIANAEATDASEWIAAFDEASIALDAEAEIVDEEAAQREQALAEHYEDLGAPVPNENPWSDDRYREAGVLVVDEPTCNYNLSIHRSRPSVVTFVHDGDLVSVDSNHDAYVRVLEALLSGQDPTVWLDEAAQVEAIVEQLSKRLQVVFPADPAPDDHDPKPVVLFDGEPIHGRMVDVFLRYHLEGREAGNLVRFLERCKANPVPGAAEGLFNWGGSERLTINEDGCFIGYKSLRSVAGGYAPGQRGPGEVNGVRPEDGVLVQKVGDVVTIDPALVTPGPECSVGLHVGSWDYAAGFGGDAKFEVIVDPADVVNVPDYDTGKMRVVRYEVAAIHVLRDGLARHHEPVARSEESVVVALRDADVPVRFWKRLLARKGRGNVGVVA